MTVIKLQRASPFDPATSSFATKRRIVSFSAATVLEKAQEPGKEGLGQETLQGIADKIVSDLIRQGLTFHDAFAVIEMMQELLEYIQGRHRSKLDTTPVKELMMARTKQERQTR